MKRLSGLYPTYIRYKSEKNILTINLDYTIYNDAIN